MCVVCWSRYIDVFLPSFSIIPRYSAAVGESLAPNLLFLLIFHNKTKPDDLWGFSSLEALSLHRPLHVGCSAAEQFPKTIPNIKIWRAKTGTQYELTWHNYFRVWFIVPEVLINVSFFTAFVVSSEWAADLQVTTCQNSYDTDVKYGSVFLSAMDTERHYSEH